MTMEMEPIHYWFERLVTDMAERLTAADFEEKVGKATVPVLVDFYSDSCVPCKRMAGVIGKIEEEYEGKVLVYKVNTNFEKELAAKYQIQSAPTFLVFQSGEITARLTGVQKKEDLIEKLL